MTEEEDRPLRVTRKELSDIALAAAKEAVRQSNNELFGLLGYNLADQDDTKALREDFIFIRKMRVNSGRVSMAFIFALMAVLASALAVTVWEGIKALAHRA